jgi:hypothetical protein
MNTTIPTWQTKIRAAQATEEKRIAEQVAKLEEEKRRQDEEDAGQLKKALACLGIESAPTSNEWELDGYHFQLKKIDHADAVHFHRTSNGHLSFKLRIVRPAIHELYGQLEYADPYERLDEVVSTEGFVIPEDAPDEQWHQVRSAVAYALDRLDEKEASLKQRVEEQRHRVARLNKTVLLPSPAERLVQLIGELVGDEVRVQLGHDDE